MRLNLVWNPPVASPFIPLFSFLLLLLPSSLFYIGHEGMGSTSFLSGNQFQVYLAKEFIHWRMLLSHGPFNRVQRVGFFNFGTDWVRVLEKTSGSGSGMDRVRVLAPCFLSIGYYRVFKILIGYFLVTSLIRYFLLVQLRPLVPSARLTAYV